MSSTDSPSQYQTLKTTLLNHPHTFVSLPTSPLPLIIPQKNKNQPPSSSSSSPPLIPIASLSLHPTLEVTLHLLNRDLTSAHFLLRHSQAAPDYESMYLHGILHRIEGDVDNARAWYGDVEGQGGVMDGVWSGKVEGKEGGWKTFLDRVERWRDSKAKKGGDDGEKGQGIDWEREKDELNEISLGELRKVLEACEKKFGTGEVRDATSEYTMNGDKGDQAANMVTGGEGWREF